MPKTTNPLLRRKSTASPIKSPARRPSHVPEERLDEVGAPPSLAPPGNPQDVQSLMRYILARTFDPIPETAAGMGSERISEVLRFRARLPPIVSIAHLHALSKSPTRTERELAGLIARGIARKINVPGRGKGGAAIGEGVVLVSDWIARLNEDSSIPSDLKAKYIALMTASPTSQTTPTPTLSKDELRTLVQFGYLTSPTALSTSTTSLFSPAPSLTTTPSLTRLSSAGSLAPTGTLAAVGGSSALHDSGGSGSMLATSSSRPTKSPPGQTMTFALPATGAYLKLLTTARMHLLTLLRQLSPRYREATWDLLKEKWEGNLRVEGARRGSGGGVLPAKTRKWREFWGLRFEWVVAEAVGAGVVEVFGTGIGVWGVRGL